MAVHPRLRGELELDTVTHAVRTGSSPLTRGTLSYQKQQPCVNRFIPAYAGNSDRTEGVVSQAAVHPRLRGELSWKLTPAELETGSSPLTRGTPWFELTIETIFRFIPAYAGNSTMPFWVLQLLTVHPRLRGELT